MTIGSSTSYISTLPPTFAQKLLELPQPHLDKLVSRLDTNAEKVEKLLKVKDEVETFHTEYTILAAARLAEQTKYDAALAADTAAARNQAPQAPAAKILYDRASKDLQKLTKTVESIKNKLTELFSLVKESSSTVLDEIKNLSTELSCANLTHQDYLNKLENKVRDFALGTDGNSGILTTIEQSNKDRKLSLQAFKNARAIYLSQSSTDKKVEEAMKKSSFNADYSKALRASCQQLADTDLDQIFGKDSTERKTFVEMLQKGKTRDTAGVPRLVKLLSDHPAAVKKLVAEFLARINEKRKINQPCSLPTVIAHHAGPIYHSYIEDYTPDWVVSLAQSIHNLGGFIPDFAKTGSQKFYDTVSIILPYNPLTAPAEIPAQPKLSPKNQVTLDELSGNLGTIE